MMVDKMIQIHKGSNSMGGIYIYEEIIEGKVVKVNKKSIRVRMSQAKCLTNGKVTREYNINEEATFDFWKTIDRQFGKNTGKTVSIYKNKKYGIIEIVH